MKMIHPKNLPDGWHFKKIEYISSFIRGGNGFPERYQGKTDGKYPFIKVSDMNHPENWIFIKKSYNFVNDYEVKKLHLTIFEPNTIVFAKVGAALLLNRRRILTEKTVIDNNMMGIAPNKYVDYLFLYYQLLQIDFGIFVQPGALPSVNQNQIENLSISLPQHLNEQRTIATILSSIDNAIDQINQLIEKYQRIKQGLMHDLFCFGIDEHGNFRSEATHRFKDSPLGRIPEEWDCLKIGDIYSDIRTGSTPRRTRPDYFTGNILWVTSGELKYEVVLDTREKITDEAVKDTNLKIYPAGTFAIAIIGLEAEGTLGSCAIIGKEASINQSCVAFPENHRVYTWYFYQYYRYYGKFLIYRYARGTKQQNLNTEVIKSIYIKLPRKDEQIKIAELLNNIDNVISNYRNNALKFQNIKQGLMDDLLSGKVRVNVLIKAEA
ncbi:MAG: restriction endonuclease subunit S [Methanoregula sp.]|nr:restriction endonuclease subunit S [Methanoregula sp.]